MSIKIIINDAEGSLYIEDAGSSTYKMDGNGDIDVKAPKDIKINVGENMNINAGSNLILNSGNQTTMNTGEQMHVTTPYLQQLISNYYHTQAGKVLINSQDEIKIEGRQTSVAGTERLLMHSDQTALLNSQGMAEVKGEQGTSLRDDPVEYVTAKDDVTGYWTDLKDKKIEKAILGETVRFHIIGTTNIPDGIKVLVQVYEWNLLINTKLGERKDITFKDNQGHLDIFLDQEKWEKLLDDPGEGDELELFCRVYGWGKNTDTGKYLKVSNKVLTPKEAVAISAHVYGDKKDSILLGGWRVSKKAFGKLTERDYNDPNNTGLSSAMYERVVDGRVTEYVYAFAGTAGKGDKKADIEQPFGFSEQYHKAAYNAKIISDALQPPHWQELSFTGHSLGGGEAALSALVADRKAITFNAAGVSDDTKMTEGVSTFKSEERIEAYIMVVDPLNALQRFLTPPTLTPDPITSTANGNPHPVKPVDMDSVKHGHSIDSMLKSFGIDPEKYKK